jgi:hypothetical protein
MKDLAIFIPLQKADAAQRLVYGCFDETPDRAREVFDYATSKPNFERWSDNLFKASGGKSYGNVRAQHDPKRAAGLLKSIEFDDENKRIEFCAHIVDDQEWAKVEAGVYTGFSPGGRYAKRWQDGDLKRYTADVAELSIVDVPCNPAAGFMMVKADGTEEEVEFVIAKAYEPGNEATKARALEMAKSENPEADEADLKNLQKNYVGKARSDLIAEKADEELAELAKADAAAEDSTAEGDASNVASEGEGEQAPDRAAALDAALSKADAVLADEDTTPTRLATLAAVISGETLAKAAPLTDLPFVIPSAEAIELIGADLSKSIEAVKAIRTAAEPILAKGLYSITEVACSLQSFAWIAQDVAWEAAMERDGSSLPQQAVNLVNALKAFLIALVEEEVAEMLSRIQVETAGDVALVLDAAGDGTIVMELANKIVDLVKADTALMEKAGARNSKADADRIQSIHDSAMELGASCPDATAEKAHTLEEENDTLRKSIDKALPAIEKLTETVEELKSSNAEMAEQIGKLSGQPVMRKGVAFSIDKSEDNGGALSKADNDPEPGSLEAVRALPDGRERSRALIDAAEAARVRTRTPA